MLRTNVQWLQAACMPRTFQSTQLEVLSGGWCSEWYACPW